MINEEKTNSIATTTRVVKLTPRSEKSTQEIPEDIENTENITVLLAQARGDGKNTRGSSLEGGNQ